MIAGFRNNHLIVKNGRWKSFPCACEFEGARRRGLMRSVALDPTDIRNRWVVSVSWFYRRFSSRLQLYSVKKIIVECYE